MKLIRFGEKGNEKPGVFYQGKRLDCSKEFKDWDSAFFQNNGLEKLKKYLEANASGLPVIADSIRHASCISRPGMIMCIGLNYSEHAAESNMAIPEEPIIFGKATNTLSGPYDDVAIPKNSTKTDYEVELGVVLKRNVLYLKNEAEAAEAIAGYCIINDLSERTFQLEKGGQWIKGKSCPGFSPVGPYLATPDELGDLENLKMTLSVNGELRQNGNTSFMIFRPAFIIYYLSQFMLLEAGDLISTGTPAGVGIGLDPPSYLAKGDLVELGIEGLGTQKQKMI
ncbi:fumarylacetoacetate hydrolase family protein [uncultured Eudoraea sp.]|uniref:fumarylacetoacetate hydrolase family protein n=1 Tax=uncultured Eudoraea sp. TaxID=1035614 RepID=UPI00262D6ED0|nr:fumarylacetoacetate hydrolase family protein [uncultured Eudoraea sp.]